MLPSTLSRPGYHIRHRLAGGPQGLVVQVGVAGGHARTGVTQEGLHVVETAASTDGQAGKAVPQIVPAHRRQTGSGQATEERGTDIAQGFSRVTPRKQPAAALRHAGLLRQNRHGGVVEVDVPGAGLGFGQKPQALAELDIFDPGVGSFAQPHAGEQQQGNRGRGDGVLVRLQCGQQSARLLRRQGDLALVVLLEAVDPSAPVALDVVQCHGAPAHGGEQRQVPVHRGRAVRLAQLAQVGLDVPAPDRRQLQVREGRQQPTPQFAGIVSMAAFVLPAVGQVRLGKLAEGQVDPLFLLPRVNALLDLGAVRQGQPSGIGHAQRREAAQADRSFAARQHEAEPEGLAAAGHRQAQAGNPIGIADLDGLGAVGAAQPLDGAGREAETSGLGHCLSPMGCIGSKTS